MAYEFAGTSSQRLSTASAPVSTFPLTIACRFYVTATSGVQSLISLEKSGGAFEGYFTRTSNANLEVRVGNAGVFNTGASTITANAWNHSALAVTASTYTGWLNGSQEVSAAWTPSVPNAAPNSVNFGARTNTTIGFYLTGGLAEVGIWNVALATAEIASLADGMTCDKVRPQSLQFYAPLIRNLQDLKAGVTITNNNTATVANHPRVYA